MLAEIAAYTARLLTCAKVLSNYCFSISKLYRHLDSNIPAASQSNSMG